MTPAVLRSRLRQYIPFSKDAPPLLEHGAIPTAAVLILIDITCPQLPILFTVRSTNLRHHPGEISFPGGRMEGRDSSPSHCALRETFEEVALPHTHVEVAGYLTPFVTFGSNMWLIPVIGMLTAQWDIVHQQDEIDSYFWAPLESLATGPHHVRTVQHDGKQYPVHFFTYDAHVIWGATGKVLAELCSVLGYETDTATAQPL